MNYPSTAGMPVNEFTTEGYIALAFPVLFPTGKGDYLQARPVPISRDKYFKYLMHYEDGRFAKDPRFRYFAMNTILRHSAISKSNIYIKNMNIKGETLQELQNRITENRSLLYNIMAYYTTLRSTSAYWHRRSNELTHMVDQLGKATIFFTLSAADYHWSDLFRLLISEWDIDDLTDNERRQVMHENPIIVGYFFQERAHILINNVMVPLFKVKDYWFRFEWQHRGSPRVHGIMYCSDEPQVDYNKLSNDDIEILKSYFDKLCYAINPMALNTDVSVHPSKIRFSDVTSTNYAQDLSNLLNAFQRHTKCGSHCLRSKNNVYKCRYNFPHDTSNVSMIDDENGYFTFKPKRNDQYIQTYNNIITQVWRANTDCTLILDLKAVISYIAKYASKAEKTSKSYLDFLNDLINAKSQDDLARSALTKIIVSCVSERDYSAQKVAHILMGWPLYSSSRSFVYVNTNVSDWHKLEVIYFL
ncbi:hypothetical protein TKK_0014481 [Trichogramma kaykai]|uniref:Helitron helicase-like domain-containing protein n=1 Tax=Trichogramma kaykai TaxID=54128 RepID=A0ABD2WD32_9HYME